MKSMDIWYLIVTEKELDTTDEDSDIIFRSYVDGMWDDYDIALKYIKAIRDHFRSEAAYDLVRNEHFCVGSGYIDYDVSCPRHEYEFKVRKKIVNITKED